MTLHQASFDIEFNLKNKRVLQNPRIALNIDVTSPPL